jgi:hypothetical protein
MEGEADLSFRVHYVPSRQKLEQIVSRLPKSPTANVQCRQEVRSEDGPAAKNTISACNTDVKVILPSQIIRRELANPQVARSLILNRSSIDPDDQNVSRREFVDSVVYANHGRVLSPCICFGLFEKAYVGDAVADVHGNIYIIIDINNEDAESPETITVRGMQAFLASRLSKNFRSQVSEFCKDNLLDMDLDMLLIVKPVDSAAAVWDPKLYKVIKRDQISKKIDFVWNSDLDDLLNSKPLICCQISSTSGAIEQINMQPFEANYKRWRPFDGVNADAMVYFQIYVDGFRTWLSRSGNVTGIYMSLCQLPIEMLNRSENVNLVSLVPAGVDVMEVLRVVSDDISRLHSTPVKLWLADPINGLNGRWIRIQPVFAFLKGDTPQRAVYTSTSGSTGSQLCHACNSSASTFIDAFKLTQQRRSMAQWRRVKSLIGACKTSRQVNNIRMRFGYTRAGLSVSQKTIKPKELTLQQNCLMEIPQFNLYDCCPVDPSHTIWYGLIMYTLQLFRNRVFDTATRIIFDQRLLLYPWPRGMPRVTFNVGSPKLKRWSMSIYKQIALILPALFWKLIDDDDFDTILDIMDIVQFYAASSYTISNAREVAIKAVATFGKIVRRFPHDGTASINVKKPTMHMVLEYLFHDVLLFGHRASDCLSEEHKHQTVSSKC